MPGRRRRTHAVRRRGFALIAALALLVVLGSAGAMMLRMTSIQQAGGTTTILGARAEWAARSGVDWAIHRAVALGDCPSPTSTLNLAEGVLVGFRVVVRCTATRHFEGSDVRTSLRITSEAAFGVLGSRDFVYREIQASAVL